MHFLEAFDHCPLIAILQDVRPHEVVAIGQALIQSGFTCIEVPLNSPEDPLASIYHLNAAFRDRALIGAGMVLQREQIREATKCGARVIALPHADINIIHAAKEANLYCIPGFSTPTEAFSAINAGADALSYFPADNPAVLKSINAVLPSNIPVLPVGAIGLDNMDAYLQVGAKGFGLSNSLYQAGDLPAQVANKARAFYAMVR